MANTTRSVEREACWRERLARFRASGLSVRAYCRQEQLAAPSFYAWRRTLAERDGHAPARRRTTAASRPAFVPVLVTDPPASEAAIVLELGAGRRLRLPASIAIERLSQLLTALETAGGAR